MLDPFMITLCVSQHPVFECVYSFKELMSLLITFVLLRGQLALKDVDLIVELELTLFIRLAELALFLNELLNFGVFIIQQPFLSVELAEE